MVLLVMTSFTPEAGLTVQRHPGCWLGGWAGGLLGLHGALVIDAHADRLAVALGLAAPDALIVLAQLGDVAEALRLKAGARLRFGEAVGTRFDGAGGLRTVG